MQKAPILKGSGLKPLEESKSSEEVHVFGKNLEERVIAHKEDEKSSQVSFTTSQSEQNHSEDDIESIKKRKFDAITGEEDEETVFQGDFKLFVWDKESSNWMEKGRGQLRLNDSIEDQVTKSRLIMRISGTLRIILNVSIKQSAFKMIASSKTNIRFTDSLSVWAVSGSNAQQLKKLIEERLVKYGHTTDGATEDESIRKPTEDEPTKKPKSDSVVEGEQSDSPEVIEDNENPPESEHVEAEDDTHGERAPEEDAHEKNNPENDSHEDIKSENDTSEENTNEDVVHEESRSTEKAHEENGALVKKQEENGSGDNKLEER